MSDNRFDSFLPKHSFARPNAQMPPSQSDGDSSYLDDLFNAAKAGFHDSWAADAETIHQLTGSEAAAEVRDNFQGWADQALDKVSSDMQRSMGKNWKEGIGDLDWWTANSAQLGGQIGALLLGTKGAGLLLRLGGKVGARIIGRQAAASATKAAARMGLSNERAAALGVTAGTVAMAGGQRAIQAREDFESQTDEQLYENPEFAKVYHRIKAQQPELSVNELYAAARNEMAEAAASSAFKDPSALLADVASGALGGYIGGAGGFLGAGKSRVANAVKGALVEGGTEALQEGASQRAVNVAMAEQGAQRGQWEGVGDAAMTAGLLSVPLGGGGGFMRPTVQPDANKPNPEPDTAKAPEAPTTASESVNESLKQASNIAQDILNRQRQEAERWREQEQAFSEPAYRRNGGQNAEIDAIDAERAGRGRVEPLLNRPTGTGVVEKGFDYRPNFTMEGEQNEAPREVDGQHIPRPRATRATSESNRLVGATYEGHFERPNPFADDAQQLRLEQRRAPVPEYGEAVYQAQRNEALAQHQAQAALERQALPDNREPVGRTEPEPEQPQVNIKANGEPFKTEKHIKLSRPYREALAEGAEPEIIPVDGGFGWVQKNEASQAKKPQLKGSKDTVYTPNNSAVEVEYGVMEAADLVASNNDDLSENAAYPQALQNRKRNTSSSRMQIDQIANNLIPRKLLDSADVGTGAPVVKNGVVESGNGRTLALRKAYRTGQGENYRQALIERATALGLDADAIAGMSQPVLVRERLTDMDASDLEAFTKEANVSEGVTLRASEQAKSDAEQLTSDDLALINIPESGDISSSANQAFIRRFLSKVGKNEVAAMTTEDNQLSQGGANRMQNAIFATAYQSDRLIDQATDATTGDLKNINNALVFAAPEFAKLHSMGSVEGLVETITEAVELVKKSRRSGQALKELTSQATLDGEMPAKPVALLAETMDNNIRSPRRLGEMLRSLATSGQQALENAQTDGLFGEAPSPTAESLINANDYTKPKTQPSQAGFDLGQPFKTRGEAEAEREAQRAAANNNDPQGDSESQFTQAERTQANVEPQPKPQPDSKLDALATQLSDKKKAAAAELAALFKSKKGQLNSGIDPELLMAVAKLGGYTIAEGTVKFAQWSRDVLSFTRNAGISDDDVKPYLKATYGAISADPAAYDVSDEQADLMDSTRQVAKLNLDEVLESDNVPVSGDGMERASERPAQAPVDQALNENEPERARRSDGEPEQATDQTEQRERSTSLSADDGAISGTPSTDQLFSGNRAARLTQSDGDTGRSGRGDSDSDTGTRTKPKRTARVRELANEQLAEQQQAAKEAPTTTEIKRGDIDNIRATLPVLHPEQATDIEAAEKRLFYGDNIGAGFLNTNGTGTGKTFNGLGMAKRSVMAGDKDVLIVTPNDEISKKWVKQGKQFFDLDIYQLGSGREGSTTDAGQGVTITTYATLGQNAKLITDRERFKLIITDESHTLMAGKNFKPTDALNNLRALVNHPDGKYYRARAYFDDELRALDTKTRKLSEALQKRDDKTKKEADAEARSQYNDEYAAIERKVQAKRKEFDGQEQYDDVKLYMLSASPFAYVRNLDYAEGFLFNYTDYGDKWEGGYDNAFHGHNAFYIKNFGYRWRYHKLTTPDADVDNRVMEAQFHEQMKKKGALGGRTLKVDADYNRVFVETPSAIGAQLDQVMEFWRGHKVDVEDSDYQQSPFWELSDIYRKVFPHHEQIKLLEAIKAPAVVERVRDHIDQGRKAVVFHTYNVGGSTNPLMKVEGKNPELFAQFKALRPDLAELDFGNLARPLDVLEGALGEQVVFVNGTQSKAENNAAIAAFQDDASPVKVIVVQQDKGNAGIDLHDVTGAHQRVIINMGLPSKPTLLIQTEGRIYRTGVVSDAQFEYLTTGTAFERRLFASTIADRSATVENLAMGEQARALNESISDAYAEAAELPVQTVIGKGGKERDRANATLTPWDKAKSYYWSQLKRNSKTKAMEGEDYFATPEPLGLKMVQWLQAKGGDRLLEPSVGHGAIGRWFGATTRNKAIEPSYILSADAELNFNGQVYNQDFESFDVINKFDGIVMNPPFGKGGSLAYAHIQKAITHLANGGRILAIVPDGPAANKRLEKLLEAKQNKNIYLAGEISLPSGAFARAGTGVKTKILILDRFNKASDAPTPQYLSFDGAKDVNELFDRIEDIELKPRNEATKEPVDVELNFTTRMKGDRYVARLRGEIPDRLLNVLKREVKEFDGYAAKDGGSFSFSTEEGRADFMQYASTAIAEAIDSGVEITMPPKPKAVEKVEGSAMGMQDMDSVHSKKGHDLFVVNFDGDMGDHYDAISSLAKKHGGFYIRASLRRFYKPKDGIAVEGKPTFTFDSDEERQAFKQDVNQLFSDVAPSLNSSVADSGVVSRPSAVEIVDRINRVVVGWRDAPTTKVVERFSDLSDEDQQRYRNLQHGAQGWFDAHRQTVYLNAENIDSVADAEEILIHEWLRHHGFRKVFGRDTLQILNKISLSMGQAQIRKLFDKYNIPYEDYKAFYAGKPNHAGRMMDELLAHIQPQDVKPKTWDLISQLFTKLKLWLTERGFDGLLGKYQERDLFNIVAIAAKEVKNKPPVQKKAGDGIDVAPSLKTPTVDDKIGLGERDPIGDFVDEVKDQGLKPWAKSLFSRVMQRSLEGVFDGLKGLQDAEKAAGLDPTGVDAERSGYVGARLASSVGDVVAATLKYGAPQWRDGIIQYKENSQGLLEILSELGDDLNNWLSWMAANRAERLMGEGRENNLTADEIAELKARAEGKEELFDKVRQNYLNTNHALLELAQEAGLLSKEQVTAFKKDEYYLPFYRQSDEDTNPISPFMKRGLSHQTAGIRKLKGSDKHTNDLLENILLNSSKIIDASMKNMAMQKAVENLKDTDYLSDESWKYKPVIVPKGEINKYFKQQPEFLKFVENMLGMKGANTAEVVEEMVKMDADSYRQMFALTKPSGADVVEVKINGKPRFYRVNDPALLRALTQVDMKRASDVATRTGRWFKHLLTTGVTADPTFILRNYIRDAAHAWTISPDKFRFGVDSVKGMKASLEEAQSYRDLMFAGASFQGGYLSGNDPQQRTAAVRRALAAKGLSRSQQDSYIKSLLTKDTQWQRALAKGWEWYRDKSDKVENANRVATYEAALAAGKSKAQAAFESKDLMDYGLLGNFKALQAMVDFLPFFNARMQGLYKLVRASGDNRDGKAIAGLLARHVAVRGAYIAAFSIALAKYNDDDDEIQALPDWDKNANWHFRIAGELWRLPKPFELGIVFGTIPERMAQLAMGNDEAGDFTNMLTDSLVTTLQMNPMPQILKPAYEVYANRDSFMDRPIEGLSDQNKLPELRYSNNTSDTAKELGGLIGASPKKIEHLVRGYTGSLGAYVLAISDLVTREFIDAPERPSSGLERWPVLKAVYGGKSPKSNKYMAEFYDLINEVDEIHSSINSLRREGQREDAAELAQEHSQELRARRSLKLHQKQVKALTGQINIVMRNRNLSAEQKRERIDQLMAKRNAVVQQAVERAHPYFN